MRGALRATVCAVACAVLISLGGCATRPGPQMRGRATAVVLTRKGARSTLVLVDLDRGRVTGRVPLRSPSYSIDGDPSTRLLATAQTGMPHNHDTACGVYDVDAGGRVTYVDTQMLNPGDLAVAGSRAYVEHGLFEVDHLLGSVVDLADRSLIATVPLPDQVQRPERVLDRVLLPVAAAHADEGHGLPASVGQLVWFDQGGARSTLATLSLSAMTVVGSSPSSEVVVVGRELDQSNGASASWSCQLVNPALGRVVKEVQVLGIERGIFNGCVVGDEIALCDSDGVEPTDPGHAVIFLDVHTLQETRRIRLKGTPAAAKAWGTNLVVFDPLSRKLLVYPRDAEKPSKRIRVAEVPDLTGDLCIFP